MLTTILATVVVLGVLIFVHELGHFMTAKWADIEVPRFSIGFGPKILGFRRGETEYVISLLPLGGYVKMAGMEEMEQIEGGVGETPSQSPSHEPEGPAVPVDASATDDPDAPRPHGPRDFEAKSLPVRALVISAGVIMNLLFAFVVFTIIAAAWGVPGDPGNRIGDVVEEELPAEGAPLTNVQPGATITAVNDETVTTWREFQLALTTARAGQTTLTFADAPPVTFSLPADDEQRGALIYALRPAFPTAAVIGQVTGDGAGRAAGMQTGDSIMVANGIPVTSWQHFVSVVEHMPGVPVELQVMREGQPVTLIVTPEERVLESGLRVGRIGIGASALNEESALPRERSGPFEAVVHGATQTWEVTALTVDFLAGMFTGRLSARNVGGPIAIGQMSGRFARLGLESFLGFMALLSVNLAVLNLLPIPVLDGGHLVFLGVEGIRGRPLSIEQRMRFTQVGFVLIIMLMVWAIGNDLLRAIGI